MSDEDATWMTAHEAAQLLGVSVRVVKRRAKAGALVHRVVGGRLLIARASLGPARNQAAARERRLLIEAASRRQVAALVHGSTEQCWLCGTVREPGARWCTRCGQPLLPPPPQD